jgi:hypothetical protein
MKTIVILAAGIAIGFLFSTNSQAEKVTVGDFSNSNLLSWKEKSFSGKTQYALVTLNDTVVLKSESRGTASGLFKNIEVDLNSYPYLNWSWRIENRLTTEDEQVKSGDDYAARVYIIIDGGYFPWRTRALNYVWANNAQKYDVWPNAFAGKNAMMVAIRNKSDSTATWYHEKRNILSDLREILGKEQTTIDAIAIMTDTDNNQDAAVAYYGDIYFSAK